ncbi:hypothetical protein Y032_0364g3561 [Ancylostoma ceylanicum]|uniref:Uncharacterized protein n=1 Tax=Ancylostoma ceylanicum TaxID=53326 RepID=A0A016RV98_9BILA|nr:hypothetical protein Y032_0364g3561 [Ancylostoma ceylanicum]
MSGVVPEQPVATGPAIHPRPDVGDNDVLMEKPQPDSKIPPYYHRSRALALNVDTAVLQPVTKEDRWIRGCSRPDMSSWNNTLWKRPGKPAGQGSCCGMITRGTVQTR